MVMYHGRNVGEFTPANADMQQIGYLMTDGKYAPELVAPAS